MNSDASSLDDIRAAVALLRTDTPSVQDTAGAQGTAGRLWKVLPLGLGVVPVRGARDTALGELRLEGFDVTLADLQDAEGQLIAKGLGSLAAVLWEGPGYTGSLVAWGDTAEAAIHTLTVRLEELWPELTAAVDAIVGASWAPGQGHVSRTGVSITAPVAGPGGFGEALRVRRADADLLIGTQGTGWLNALLRAVANNPVRTVAAFDAEHAAAGRPNHCILATPGNPSDRQALVAPALELWTTMAAARFVAHS